MKNQKDLAGLSFSANWRIFRVLMWTQLWLLRLLIVVLQLAQHLH
ncbi:MAG: hypothetical protein AB7F86_02490 [Bdellovibrionales bacterium]